MSDLTTPEYERLAADLAERYANGYVGVGDGITAFTGGETDLQGTNKVRSPVDSVVASGSEVTFYATFAAGVASFEWNEAGLFEAASGGHMAAAKVIDSLGTKSGSQTWVYGLTIDLAPA